MTTPYRNDASRRGLVRKYRWVLRDWARLSEPAPEIAATTLASGIVLPVGYSFVAWAYEPVALRVAVFCAVIAAALGAAAFRRESYWCDGEGE